MAISRKISSERNEIAGRTREPPPDPKSESKTKPQQTEGQVAVLNHWLQWVATDRSMIFSGTSQFRVLWDPRNLGSASPCTDHQGITCGCVGTLFSPGELINCWVRT